MEELLTTEPGPPKGAKPVNGIAKTIAPPVGAKKKEDTVSEPSSNDGSTQAGLDVSQEPGPKGAKPSGKSTESKEQELFNRYSADLEKGLLDLYSKKYKTEEDDFIKSIGGFKEPDLTNKDEVDSYNKKVNQLKEFQQKRGKEIDDEFKNHYETSTKSALERFNKNAIKKAERATEKSPASPFVEELKNAPRPISINPEKDARKIVSQFQTEITGKPESQGLVQDAYLAASNVPGAINKAFVSGMAATPKTVAMLAQKLDQLTGMPAKGIEEYATYQLGEYVENKAKELGLTVLQNPDYAGFMTSTLPQAVGSMLSMMLLGGRGATTNPFVTQSIAKQAATTLTSKTAMVGAMQASVPEFEAAKAAGKTDEEAFNVFLQNIPGGLTESVQMANMFGRLNRMTNNGLMNAIKLSTANGLEEASQEAIQQYLTNKVAQGSYDPERDLKEGMGEGAGAGFIVGFVLPGAIAAMDKMSPEQKTQTKAVLQRMLEQGYYIRTPQSFSKTIKSPSQVVSEARTSVKSADDTQGAEAAAEKILETTQGNQQPNITDTAQDEPTSLRGVKYSDIIVGDQRLDDILDENNLTNLEKDKVRDIFSRGVDYFKFDKEGEQRFQEKFANPEDITDVTEALLTGLSAAKESAFNFYNQKNYDNVKDAINYIIQNPNEYSSNVVKAVSKIKQKLNNSSSMSRLYAIDVMKELGIKTQSPNATEGQDQNLQTDGKERNGQGRQEGLLTQETGGWKAGDIIPANYPQPERVIKSIDGDLSETMVKVTFEDGTQGAIQKKKPSPVVEEKSVETKQSTPDQALSKYENDEKYTIDDLVDELESSDNPKIQEAVAKYRADVKEGLEVWGGREDSEARETGFVNEIRKITSPQQQPNPDITTVGDNYVKRDNRWFVKDAEGIERPLISDNPNKTIEEQNTELAQAKELKTQLESETPVKVDLSPTGKSRIAEMEAHTPEGRVRKWLFGGGQLLWNSKSQGEGKPTLRGLKDETGYSNKERQDIKQYVHDTNGVSVEQAAEQLAAQYQDRSPQEYRNAIIEVFSSDPKKWYEQQVRDEDPEYALQEEQRFQEAGQLTEQIKQLETQEEGVKEINQQLYENERRVNYGSAATEGQTAGGQVASPGSGGQAQVQPRESIRKNRDANKSKQALEELKSKNLTHVPGLGMGANQAKGTYISTEELGNRYERRGTPVKVKVNIQNPFVSEGNEFYDIQREIIQSRFGKEKIEDLTETESDLLAEMVTEHFTTEGFDSIYMPQSETQEGELIVFDRSKVTIMDDARIEYENAVHESTQTTLQLEFIPDSEFLKTDKPIELREKQKKIRKDLARLNQLIKCR